MFDTLSLRAKIILGNAISLLFLITIGVISYKSINQLNETDMWVDHTHRVINQALKIESAAVDMETGMRGYLLAGREQFLEPYKSGKRHFEELVGELKTTVSDNPSQVALLGEIESNIQEWQTTVIDDSILLRREIGDAKTMNDMAMTISEARGKEYFDRFRGLVDTFILRERILLEQRESAFSNATSVDEISQSVDWVSHTYQVIEKALLIEASALDMETGMRGFLLAGRDTFLEPYNEGRRVINTLISDLKVKVSDNPEQVVLLGEIDTVISDWRTDIAEPQIMLRREIGNGKTMDDIADLVAEAKGKFFFDTFRGQIATFIEREEVLMAERQAKAAATVSETNYTLIFGVIIAVIVAIPTTFILSKSIMRPFQKIFRGLETFSSKELMELNVAFNGVVKKMSQSANRVATVSNSIDNVSQNLSQISNRQASSVEETSASTEEISGMVRINVQAAEESRDLSKQVGEKMSKLDEAMDKISESNQKIAELVKIIGEIGAKTEIIDEIVFQTKLLSFNASVEAERAGEHGRGFAVVAQEVGNLAQMSGKAATDIASIVRQSICEAEAIAKENTTRVEKGSTIVAETRMQSNQVLEGTTRISDASNEQARGIQEISNAVESINKATQHAASIADQASGSSSELSSQAEELNRMVNNLNSFLKGHDKVLSGTTDANVSSHLQEDYEWQSYSGVRKQIEQPVDIEHTSSEVDKDNKVAWNRL
ncbi:CHASE3 domain-containing protein [Enterovibrio sp. ZSDZ35]|uniref:CHASE3 domain-containing protein n=1 Tax=Enterovibrio qingdaonensis TaxID=2899818 RepID=A0ABT5QQF0_9GAMM|nr:CHASE3 domain-containing protein [Enterovibrio sp. ZSDZ35]MDD1783206.1 CHASE3 domain-containing protein [Enterovibrio sp. ZSDZ35]